MAEQTFKSPGFFEKEIDLTQRVKQISGTPAGVIGTAERGAAFVPITVGSMSDFIRKFGDLNSEKFGPYAVNEFLKNRNSLTYVRVLGAGANSNSSDFSAFDSQGIVKNAGFRIKGVSADTTTPNAAKGVKYLAGAVQFLVGKHEIHESSLETSAYPIFTDNDSFTTSGGTVNVVRGMVFLASGSRLEIMDHNQKYSDIAGLEIAPNGARISNYGSPSSKDEATFKLVLSCSAGVTFGKQEGYTGIKIYTASLNTDSDHYIGKILNKNPDNFQTEKHLLYGEFPIESGIARVKYDSLLDTVGVLSGAVNHSDNFGRFDTRYSNAKTTKFISQPFGSTEFNLFHFETLDDGDIANRLVKVSISDLKKSVDPLDEYGTFTVSIRDYYDTDKDIKILEQFTNCNLNPDSENYLAKKIGDYKVFFNFDSTTDSEKRLQVQGAFPNRSEYIRVVMDAGFDFEGNIPKNSLPFGFRGLPSLITNNDLKDASTTIVAYRITGSIADNATHKSLCSSIVPPVPMTVKATRGKTKSGGSFFGEPGSSEISDPRIYWGVKTTNLPLSSSINQASLLTNGGGVHNELVNSFTKLLGIQKLDVLTTGSAADSFNNNKFSLAKVALSSVGTVSDSTISGSANDHIVETAYIRNAVPNPNTYNISDGVKTNRISFASLVANNDSKYFNRFSAYLKFTNVFFGGFDGVNILDKDQRKMNDKASSMDGKAANSELAYLDLNSISSPGVGLNNNIISSYRSAIKILTDELSSRINILAIPGIKDSLITDYAIERVENYGKAIYLLDLETYDDNTSRLFDDNTTSPSVRITSEKFLGRATDSSFVSTYFPNVTIQDANTGRFIKAPASIAALGALGFNDSVAYPWFAPAGFNRGALDFVVNTETRLTAGDRDTLYEARINPIANFPQGGFVIFGQKTLQFAKSSLDRVNVRRMLLEVKRIVSDIATKIIFEQNNQTTRNRFIKKVTPKLASIQTQQGIDSFRVVMDASNNTAEDSEQNRLNGRIVLVPTRAVEFIAIDFIITNSGVSFE